MAQINYRTINIDAYDPESALNFPISTVLPSSLPSPSSPSEAASIGQQIRQLLRSGDAEGALQGALDTAPLAGDEGAKQVHLGTVVEVLQGIRQSDVPKVLGSLVQGDGGMGRADCLMKYLFAVSVLGAV
jgi:actin related protein 2/3 complex, subunit 5